MSALPTPTQDSWPTVPMPAPSILLEPPESPLDGIPSFAPFVNDPISISVTPEPQPDVQVPKEKLWEELAKLYNDNAETIDRAMELDAVTVANEGGAHLQRAVDGFAETAKVVSEALVALGNIHPAIGVAVFAFHSVISLDISRRENDRKVLVVKMQMQSMMCALFQLRHLRVEHFGDEDDPSRDHLRTLMKSIAQEIKQCGSDLTYYREKPAIKKFLKAKLYENRFADHITTFSERRSELQTLIASYSMAGITVAIQKQTQANEKLTSLESKVDRLTNLFRKLDSAQEAAAATFIATNGGVDDCIEKDSLLRKLLIISGEPISADRTSAEAPTGSAVRSGKPMGMAGSATFQDTTLARETTSLEQLRKMRESLVEEKELDLDKAFKEHERRFEAMLKVQNNNLQRISDQLRLQGAVVSDSNSKMDQVMTMSLMILEEGKLIKKAVLPQRLGKVHLKDPMLQELWERMGLKANVKAKHFVLGLRDHLLYHTDLSSNPPTVPPTPAFPPLDGGPLSTPEFRSRFLARSTPHSHGSSLIRIKAEERWILQYLDVLHVQPILEAMDEDGSGFISVREANRFAIARPPDCSLLGWLAYWAAGWHLTLTTYRSKIYRLLQQILQKRAPPSSTKWNENYDFNFFANRKWVDWYIGLTQDRLDMLLRSTRPSPEGASVDEHLLALATKITKAKEARIEANLKDLGYVIRSPQDARLVIGVDRVEASIYPLLYLLLSRHVEILNLASHYLLNEDEFLAHARSIMHVFSLFDERIVNLKATFTQVHLDVDRQFETFAYGMFSASYKEKDCWPPVHIGKTTIIRFSEFDEPLNLGPETPKAKAVEPQGADGNNEAPRSTEEDEEKEEDSALKAHEDKDKDSQLSMLVYPPSTRPDIPYVDQDLFHEAMRARSLGFFDKPKTKLEDEGKPVTKEEEPREAEEADVSDEGGSTRTSESGAIDGDDPSSPPEDELAPVVRALCGYWTSTGIHFASTTSTLYRLWHCVLTPGRKPGMVYGKGESMGGPMKLKGKVFKRNPPASDAANDSAEDPSPPSNPRWGIHLDAVVDSPHYFSMHIHATYDAERDEIQGKFLYFDADEEPVPGLDEEEAEVQSVKADATPAEVPGGSADVPSEGNGAGASGSVDGSKAEQGDGPNADTNTSEERRDDEQLETGAGDKPQETADAPQTDSPPQPGSDPANAEATEQPSADTEETPKAPDVELSPEEVEAKSTYPDVVITFMRTPVQFYRFKKLLDPPPSTAAPPALAPASDTPASANNMAPAAAPPAPIEPLPQNSLARRRWHFACQAVRYHVQEKLCSKVFIRERLAERRLWVKTSMDFKYDWSLGQDGTAQFSPNAMQQMFALRAVIPPANTRLYDATTLFFLRRGVKFMGWYGCDVCQADMGIGDRHHCVTCIGDNYWNQVDLCQQCLDKAYLKADTDYINHLPTHSLIRSRTMVVSVEQHVLVGNAKEKATRVKDIFRKVEKAKEEAKQSGGKSSQTGKGNADSEQTKSDTAAPACGCCEQELSLPCWVCLECDHDTFICTKCDSEHIPLKSGSKDGENRHPSYDFHTVRHHMIFLRTSQAISARKPTPQTEVAKLDKRLEDVEGRLQAQFEKRIATLEQQFNDRVKVLEEKMVQIEEKMEASSQRAEERMSAQGSLVEERMNKVINLLERLMTAGFINGEATRHSV